MDSLLVGVISDTHGLLRAEAALALDGCDLILHAGDVGRAEVMELLRKVAPVMAVRGNVDVGPWAQALPPTRTVKVGEAQIVMIHNIADLGRPGPEVAAVIYGHSHQPRIERRNGVLYLNPGSAGPRRFKLPVSVARITVEGARLDAELVTLDID